MRIRNLVVLGGLLGTVLASRSAQAARIASITPLVAAPGEQVEMRGQGFGRLQGHWQVTMSRIVDRRPQRWEMEVLAWSDTRIRAVVPVRAPSDGYLVLIARTDRPTLYSNNVVLEVARPGDDRDGPRYSMDDEYERAAIGQGEPRETDERDPSRLPWLESVAPTTVRPGDTLRLRGRDFGGVPGDRIVAVNRGQVHEAGVLSWSDREVRVRVPRSLEPGEYRVLVYRDRRYDASSNTLPVRVR